MTRLESTPARPIVSRSGSAAGQGAASTMEWTGMRKDAPASRQFASFLSPIRQFLPECFANTQRGDAATPPLTRTMTPGVSFDHLIRAGEERRGDRDAQRLR